ncbi:MAG: hypothetical protein VKQ33_03205 [Candidatus Sericytochromatia bacterium]|nr:hypothetical protein [Candidatus Sericytochromatia bacterium]
MSIKCYYHPKLDGPLACRGCKLPVCDTCRGPSGLCRTCAKARQAVHDLRELRQVAAAKARVASSSTAQLRLALRQVGPLARREGRPAVTAASPRQPLAQLDWQATAMRAAAPPRPAPREAREASWTYDPGRVAYRGVKVHKPEPASRLAWLLRFLGGFAAALATALLVTAGMGALLRATHPLLEGHAKPGAWQAFKRAPSGR